MVLPNGRVKLTDFSVARAIDDATVTHVGATVGSPAYLSPEQIHGESASAASDRWALGVLLYEMLAGRPPFAGDHIASYPASGRLRRSAHHSGAPRAVQAVLQRALAKKPTDRFASAQELAAAFRDAAGLNRPLPRSHRRIDNPPA